MEFNNKIMITCVAQNYQHTSHKLSLITPIHILQVCAPNQMVTRLYRMLNPTTATPLPSPIYGLAADVEIQPLKISGCFDARTEINIPSPNPAEVESSKLLGVFNLAMCTNARTHKHTHTYTHSLTQVVCRSPRSIQSLTSKRI